MFSFSGVTPLCGAVSKIYEIYPDVDASLCLYRDRYFLAVYAGLSMRGRVFRTAGEYGAYLYICMSSFAIVCFKICAQATGVAYEVWSSTQYLHFPKSGYYFFYLHQMK